MAISKLSGLAVQAGRPQNVFPVPTSSAAPEAGRAFHERYAAASASDGRSANAGVRNSTSATPEAAASSRERSQKRSTAMSGSSRMPAADKKDLMSVARQRLNPPRPRKRVRAKPRSRKQSEALRSIADEFNIVIAWDETDADGDVITFRPDAAHWQHAEFTLARDGCGWQLSVSTPSANDCEILRQCQRALASRFEAAGLGTIRLRVNRKSSAGQAKAGSDEE